MANNFWEENAKEWNKVIVDNGFPSREITIPAIMDAIKHVNPKNILDAGCGEGFLCQPILNLGIHYYGMDASKALIETAKEKWSRNFECASYDDLIAGRTESFKHRYDCIVFNFALLDDNTAQQLLAFRKLLTNEGIILIQTLHPCFIEKEYKVHWTEESFDFSEVEFKGTMKWYRRTLSSWFEVFSQSGLSIVDINEPRGSLNNTPSSIIFKLKVTP